MSGRYYGPLAKELRGDRKKATSLVAYARTLAQGLIEDIKRRGNHGQGMVSRVLPDGSTLRVLVLNNLGHSPIVKTWIESPLGGITATEGYHTVFAPLWVPEGLVFVPMYNEGIPFFGYCANKIAELDDEGMPKRDEEGKLILETTRVDIPRGELFAETAYILEKIPPVILNRFVNNKYLDHKDFITGITPKHQALAISGLPAIFCPSCFTPTYVPSTRGYFWFIDNNNKHHCDVPGVWKKSGVLNFTPLNGNVLDYTQFDPETVDSRYYETESEQWYVHRAEEAPFKDLLHERVFQGIKETFTDILRPFRGSYDPTRLKLIEASLAHSVDDYNTNYRLGREYHIQRCLVSSSDKYLHVPYQSPTFTIDYCTSVSLQYEEAQQATQENIIEDAIGELANQNISRGSLFLSLNTPVVVDSEPVLTCEFSYVDKKPQWFSYGNWGNATKFGTVTINASNGFFCSSNTWRQPYLWDDKAVELVADTQKDLYDVVAAHMVNKSHGFNTTTGQPLEDCTVFFRGVKYIIPYVYKSNRFLYSFENYTRYRNSEETTRRSEVAGASVFMRNGKLYLRAIVYEHDLSSFYFHCAGKLVPNFIMFVDPNWHQLR